MAGYGNAAVTSAHREVRVAETLKKGTRVTGADRTKLAADLKKRYDAGESIRSLAASTGRSYGNPVVTIAEATPACHKMRVCGGT